MVHGEQEMPEDPCKTALQTAAKMERTPELHRPTKVSKCIRVKEDATTELYPFTSNSTAEAIVVRTQMHLGGQIRFCDS